MYLGFAVVALKRSFQVNVLAYQGLMDVYSISTYERYVKIYWPRMKSDIFSVLTIIVLNCVTSLSVPLMAGGGKSYNLELLIYEQTIIEGNWAVASVLAAIQFFMLLVMVRFLNYGESTTNVTSRLTHKVKDSLPAIVFLSLYVILFVGGFIFQSLKVVSLVDLDKYFDFAIIFLRTLVFFMPFLLVFLTFIFLMTFLFYYGSNLQFISYFLLPSTTLIGFALYILFPMPSNPFDDVIKMAIGVNIAYSAMAWKVYIQPQLEKLKSQILVARIYRINFIKSLNKIIYPQIKQQLLVCIFVLMLVFVFEFAIAKASGVQLKLSGMFIADLVSTYRLQYGFAFSTFALIILGLGYWLFKKGSDGAN
jgi:ABC-type Fe3+ transport system permease subunit